MNKTDRKIEEQIKHIKEEHSTMGIGYHLDLLSTLIQEERKEAVRGLIDYLEANTEKIFYLGCGKMINEYLGTVESEGKKWNRR